MTQKPEQVLPGNGLPPPETAIELNQYQTLPKAGRNGISHAIHQLHDAAASWRESKEEKEGSDKLSPHKEWHAEHVMRAAQLDDSCDKVDRTQQ